jgi:hypothetical protein
MAAYPEPLAAHSALRALATRRLHSGVDTFVAAHWRAAAAAAAAADVARPYRPSARETRAVMTLTARRDADSVPHSTVSASLLDRPAQAQAQRRSCGNRKLVSAGAGGSVHRLHRKLLSYGPGGKVALGGLPCRQGWLSNMCRCVAYT